MKEVKNKNDKKESYGLFDNFNYCMYIWNSLL